MTTTEMPANQSNADPCNLVKEFTTLASSFAAIGSIVIIALLSFLEKRNDPSKCRWAGQRPGIIYPVNLLDHGDNRVGYAAAFGSMASAILALFGKNSSIYSYVPAWTATLVTLVLVLTMGLLYYPLFACLSTTWTLLGSVLGLSLSTFWFSVNIREVIMCPDGLQEEDLPGIAIAQQIPVLACLLLLMVNFAITIIKFIIAIIRRRRNYNNFEVPEDNRNRIAAPHDVEYVKKLLVSRCRTSDIINGRNSNIINAENSDSHSELQEFMVWLSESLYKNDPTFKFSPRIICIFTVAVICAYQFGMLMVLYGYQINKVSRYLVPNDAAQNKSLNTTESITDVATNGLSQVRLLFKVLSGSMFVSFILSSLFILVTIFQILTNYRTNIRRLYKGDFKHLPFGRHTYSPQTILCNSFAYAGSQIAYTLWGYIVLFLALFVTCMFLAYVVILPLLGLVAQVFIHTLGNLLAGIIITQVFIMVQALFSRTFLLRRDVINSKGKKTTEPVLALDNRKLYHNVSYFLFFFYIVLGIFGCLMTIVKGIFLGVVYLSRMDKCGLMSGFERWDKGHVYYVSFLHLEECHRHPVMLTFCDALIDIVHKDGKHRHVDNGDDLAGSSVPSSAVAYENRSHRLVRNRWLKAYTLIRNHTLLNNNDVFEWLE